LHWTLLSFRMRLTNDGQHLKKVTQCRFLGARVAMANNVAIDTNVPSTFPCQFSLVFSAAARRR
jgi:hypothetical protein